MGTFKDATRWIYRLETGTAPDVAPNIIRKNKIMRDVVDAKPGTCQYRPP